MRRLRRDPYPNIKYIAAVPPHTSLASITLVCFLGAEQCFREELHLLLQTQTAASLARDVIDFVGGDFVIMGLALDVRRGKARPADALLE